VAKSIQIYGLLDPKRVLEVGKQAVFRVVAASGREGERGDGAPAGRTAPLGTGGREGEV